MHEICFMFSRANCEGGNGDSGSSTRSSKETEEEEFWKVKDNKIKDKWR